jgi:glycosyltransferase involved in cell wall biosynthesis
MKIALVSRPTKEIRPVVPSGVSTFTYTLAEALAQMDGVDTIDVFGVGKSYFTNKKISFKSLLPTTTNSYLSHDDIVKQFHTQSPSLLQESLMNVLLFEAFKRVAQGRYDIVHDSTTSSLFPMLSDLLPVPMVTTIHTGTNSSSFYFQNMLKLNPHNKHCYVAVSRSQLQLMQNEMGLSSSSYIYNGTDVKAVPYSFETSQKGYCVWFGRISPQDDKGLGTVIDLASSIKNRVHIIGNVGISEADKRFFSEKILPNIGNNIELDSSEITKDMKDKTLLNAVCLLYPIQWEEPFGLVFIEAMAAGTPVVAYARGAAPEIIEDGVTGYLVNPTDKQLRGNFIVKNTGIEGLKVAMNNIHTMPPEEYIKMRKASRARVEQFFSATIMAKNYYDVYRDMIAHHAL